MRSTRNGSWSWVRFGICIFFIAILHITHHTCENNTHRNPNGQVPPPPTKAARAAALRAKQEEVQRLTAILDDVTRKRDEAVELLTQKKKIAQEVMAATEQLPQQLAGVHGVAMTWIGGRQQEQEEAGVLPPTQTQSQQQQRTPGPIVAAV